MKQGYKCIYFWKFRIFFELKSRDHHVRKPTTYRLTENFLEFLAMFVTAYRQLPIVCSNNFIFIRFINILV